MSFPYTEEMMESVKKVEATRAARMAAEPRRMTAEEKDALLEQYHPDYNLSSFAEIIVGPNKGEKAPKELVELLQAKSRVQGMTLDLAHPDYDVDVLVIGGGGSGASAAIEAHEAGANVMIVTKLRIGDANTMMAEGVPAEGGGEDVEGGAFRPGHPKSFRTVRFQKECGKISLVQSVLSKGNTDFSLEE